MKARFFGSLVLGAIAAAVVVVYDDTANHAALAATAARSGGHQTVASILASGFIGITLAVALVVFVAVTVLGAPRRARQAAARRQDTPARRRSRAGAGW